MNALLHSMPPSCHHWPRSPPESPGHSRASLGQSLEGSLLLSPGSWCTQHSVCAPQESVSQVLCKVWLLSVQFSRLVMSVSLQPMDCSTPGLPVHHQLLEFFQTHVHWVSDAIQPSHPLSSPSPLPGGSMVGLTTTSSKRAYAIYKSAAPRAPAPAAVLCCPVLSQDTILTHHKWNKDQGRPREKRIRNILVFSLN